MALLAALAAPLVSSLLADSPALYRWATVSGPVTAGVLFGITLGLATWRDVLSRSAAGQPAARSWPLMVGVLAGYALGQTASLAQVGSPGLAGFPSSWSVLITPLAAASAAMLTLALAAVLAGAAAALPRPALVGCALVLSSAMPATVLWMAGLIQLAADFGWPLVRVTLASVLGPWPEVVLAGVLALLLLAAGPGCAPLPRPCSPSRSASRSPRSRWPAGKATARSRRTPSRWAWTRGSRPARTTSPRPSRPSRCRPRRWPAG